MKLDSKHPHFELCEFVRQHPNNYPTFEQVKHLEELCIKVLEPIREIVGKPIIINSGFRTPVVNRIVGGVSSSLHQYGHAADITFAGTAEELKQLYNVLTIEMPWLTECILYPKRHFLHVAYAPQLFPTKHYFCENHD